MSAHGVPPTGATLLRTRKNAAAAVSSTAKTRSGSETTLSQTNSPNPSQNRTASGMLSEIWRWVVWYSCFICSMMLITSCYSCFTVYLRYLYFRAIFFTDLGIHDHSFSVYLWTVILLNGKQFWTISLSQKLGGQ